MCKFFVVSLLDQKVNLFFIQALNFSLLEIFYKASELRSATGTV